MDVHFIRHFAPIGCEGICYGSSDVAAEIPRAQDIHLELLNSLVEVDVSLHSSPLRRAALYAQELSALAKIPITTDARISEIDFGKWELRHWDDIGADDLDRWIASGYDSLHGGESLQVFDARIAEWFSGLEKTQRHVVVTHAGVIRSIARGFYGFSLDESLKLSIGFGDCISFPLFQS